MGTLDASTLHRRVPHPPRLAPLPPERVRGPVTLAGHWPEGERTHQGFPVKAPLAMEQTPPDGSVMPHRTPGAARCQSRPWDDPGSAQGLRTGSGRRHTQASSPSLSRMIATSPSCALRKSTGSRHRKIVVDAGRLSIPRLTAAAQAWPRRSPDPAGRAAHRAAPV